MCSVCGCGDGNIRIEGDQQHDHSKHAAGGGASAPVHGQHGHDDAHAHLHTHADGTTHAHPHPHDHAHHHAHEHEPPCAGGHAQEHPRGATRLLTLERDILARNNAIAAQNRRRWSAERVLALNLVSGPGAGKTTLLVETLKRLAGRIPVAVVEGDQETSHDADRIRATGAPAIQINTGKACHLDADMLATAVERLGRPRDGILFIENVGNLVCPAGFDLGEAHKVVISSVTDGEDKPLKYPGMFAASSLMLISKCDLLPHLDFNVDALIACARRINPSIGVIRLSARSGEGMQKWITWLESARALQLAAE